MTAPSGRGGGWVLGQFALLAALIIVLAIGPRWPDGAQIVLAVAGAALALAGGALAVWAGRSLGRALTPFPRPLDDAALVETGPFRVVRHPIYAGGLVFCLGLALVGGPLALVLVGALALLWARKAEIEERHLVARHPGYAAYTARVRRRLLPGIW